MRYVLVARLRLSNQHEGSLVCGKMFFFDGRVEMSKAKRDLLAWAWGCNLSFADVSYYGARESIICTMAEYEAEFKKWDARMDADFKAQEAEMAKEQAKE